MIAFKLVENVKKVFNKVNFGNCEDLVVIGFVSSVDTEDEVGVVVNSLKGILITKQKSDKDRIGYK
ncbi:MAG: hypothetical protein WCF60_01235 [Anaerobacillus sp.]